MSYPFPDITGLNLCTDKPPASKKGYNNNSTAAKETTGGITKNNIYTARSAIRPHPKNSLARSRQLR